MLHNTSFISDSNKSHTKNMTNAKEIIINHMLLLYH